jgi:hypothetical protein
MKRLKRKPLDILHEGDIFVNKKSFILIKMDQGQCVRQEEVCHNCRNNRVGLAAVGTLKKVTEPAPYYSISHCLNSIYNQGYVRYGTYRDGTVHRIEKA